LVCSRPQVDDLIVPRRLGGEYTIEPGPSVCLDLGVETAADFDIGPWSKFLGDQVSGTGAHALADVVPPDHQVAPIIGLAAHDDVDVGILSVPVINRDPVELGSEVSLGLSHQIAREGLEVREPICIIRGHDEPEMMAIPLASIGERPMIGIIVLGIEHSPGGPIPGHAVAAEIAEVRAERRPPHSMPYDTRLDHGATRPTGQASHGGEASGAPASESSAAPAPA
jgi:hypothetical protein